MKAFIITLKNNSYSENKASECVKSFNNYQHECNLELEIFDAVDKEHANDILKKNDLKWTWQNGKTCPHTGIYMKPYGVKDWRKKIGCSLSHYTLWKKCIELDEPILILEHDAVFIQGLPNIDFKFACQINDPRGATPKGDWWSELMKKRGEGIFPKTIIPYPNKNQPDGLAGNGSYLLQPSAALELINKIEEIGLWINDAFLCRKLWPDLEEFYPFITRINQDRSTTEL